MFSKYLEYKFLFSTAGDYHMFRENHEEYTEKIDEDEESEEDMNTFEDDEDEEEMNIDY